ncbi:MAG: hypothetical protein FK732_00045 [Asgard group archaeon]|nr:hypothetical protein [Asgard group archaeon]
MEIGPGPGPEPDQQAVTQNFTVSATGLVSRTFSLWIRQIFAYLIIVGIVYLIYQVATYVVILFVWGVNADFVSLYIATDPISFVLNVYLITNSVQYGLWPSAIDPSLVIELSFVFMIIGTIIYAVIAGAAIKHALDDYGTRNADISTSFSHAAGRAITLIMAQIIVSLISIALILPGLAFTIYSLLTFNLEMALSAFGLIMVGLIVLVYLTLRLAPTSAVVIAEDKSAIDSIKRSYSLTSGNVLHIFGGWIVLYLAIFAVTLVISLVLSPLLFAGGIIEYIVSIAASALLLGPIPYVYNAVLYKDLYSRSTTQPQDWW